MNVSLNDHLKKFIARQLKGGRYNNASEVVRAGLRLLEEKELKLSELEREIKRGLDSGPSQTWDKDKFLRKAHKRADDLGLR